MLRAERSRVTSRIGLDREPWRRGIRHLSFWMPLSTLFFAVNEHPAAALARDATVAAAVTNGKRHLAITE